MKMRRLYLKVNFTLRLTYEIQLDGQPTQKIRIMERTFYTTEVLMRNFAVSFTGHAIRYLSTHGLFHFRLWRSNCTSSICNRKTIPNLTMESISVSKLKHSYKFFYTTYTVRIWFLDVFIHSQTVCMLIKTAPFLFKSEWIEGKSSIFSKCI